MRELPLKLPDATRLRKKENHREEITRTDGKCVHSRVFKERDEAENFPHDRLLQSTASKN
jgi:hypothetical protein